MAKFLKRSAVTSLQASLEAAEHLQPKHAALVAAAKQLAKRVDQLDKMGWVIDGKLDNVTMPTFLRYLEALGLTVEREPAKRGPKPKVREAEDADTGAASAAASREAKARAALSFVAG